MQLGDSFRELNSVESLTSLLYRDTQTTVFTGDQGEQQLYSFTIPPNFFAEAGGQIKATLRLKTVAGSNNLSGEIKVKLDGQDIYSPSALSFFIAEGELYIGQELNLIEIVEVLGAISIANIGFKGYVPYNNNISHTLSFHFQDSNSDPTNSFRGAYLKVIHTK
jgi:hypothetical protein